MTYLIVGLGNPGKAYAETRHNIGFKVVQALADKHGWTFTRVKGMQGLLAKGVLGEKSVFLLMPETYMNSSGQAVKACISYYDIPLTQMCVVCDDIYLPFEKLRIRAFGGHGGQNGLKSIDAHLGTQEYARLRIGVGDRKEGDLADHVLSSFSLEEKPKIPDLLKRASDALECLVGKGIVQAMQFANVCQEEKTPEKNLGE
ncbi:MAG: aminoacyl-tRNA hydrolase [Verrucomicrobia bacterium]|nr:aminoacyl-tRNA hydrolase [Verrucomicrobiota bacterium]